MRGWENEFVIAGLGTDIRLVEGIQIDANHFRKERMPGHRFNRLVYHDLVTLYQASVTT